MPPLPSAAVDHNRSHWHSQGSAVASVIVTTDLVAAGRPPEPASRPTIFRRNRGKIVLIGLLAAIVGVGALWTFVTLTFSYSDGDRVGFVQKLSHKGWVCRTWEGELAMTPVPGSAPQMFWFTVRDEAVVKRIREAEGKRMALHYEEKRGLPSSCFGDSTYFITDVRVLGP